MLRVIKIIRNPVGLYNLSYDPGEEISLPEAQAQEMIETGHAVPVEEVKTGVSKVKAEKAVRIRK